MDDLTELTIADARYRMRNREISAVELTEAYLSAISDGNRNINAYVFVTEEQARRMAATSDQLFSRGDERLLEGIPLGIKDIFVTHGVHTQACSRILSGFRPGYESTVTSNLWRDGAVMLGKLNMDEFAMGSSNQTSMYGPVVNPWRKKGSDEALVPGGSSGGSAAAVASRLCAGATGSDTGGSIRQPAAFTGTVGLKPTYGRCSRWGIVSFASSFDQAGPITRDVRDSAVLLRSMASFDDKDSTSVDWPVPDYESILGRSIKGLRIGIPKEYQIDCMPDEIDKLWIQGREYLKDAGAEIIDISLPHTRYALAAYYVIASAEASSNLARYDGVRYGLRISGNDVIDMYKKTRSEGFGSEVKRRILIGTYVLSEGYYDAYYMKAQKIRSLVRQDFDKVFDQGIDAILTPTTPSAAFRMRDERKDDPIAMYMNDIFTVPVNMAGLPGISLPSALSSEGIPLALQLIARPFNEETLFQVGYILEKASGRFCPRKWW
ncbi:MAG: aspartyl-tRNA(Asn)/glutamyl-tRNA(Gln) amidotransferase subunit A [Candidatus Tokpelaia sp. JSC161]|nr:MAG: aspartyl-tRNA(Asn)/glutamyl-tRNA(Gln) amidotransferase subunit A [Candidatus Tokpelaia sp. JSC161]